MLKSIATFFTWLLHSERGVTERYDANFKMEPQDITRKGKNWTDHEKQVATQMWEMDKSLDEIAEFLTRTNAAVRNKLIAHGYSTAKNAPRYKALIVEDQ
jgi:hypothetical protein